MDGPVSCTLGLSASPAFGTVASMKLGVRKPGVTGWGRAHSNDAAAALWLALLLSGNSGCSDDGGEPAASSLDAGGPTLSSPGATSNSPTATAQMLPSASQQNTASAPPSSGAAPPLTSDVVAASATAEPIGSQGAGGGPELSPTMSIASVEASTPAPDPSDEPAPLFEGLPIPIAYVGLTDATREILEFAAPDPLDDCPEGMAATFPGESGSMTVWSECVATRVTEQINAEYQKLLNTDQVFFQSVGYSTQELPEYAEFTTAEQVDAAVESFRDSNLAVPGQLTVVISNWTHTLGGRAPTNVPLDADNGPVLAISQFSSFSIIHEIGHVLGFDHTDEDVYGDGMLYYDFCEPLSAPVLSVCNCEMNMMEAQFGSCLECPSQEYSLVSETHADFFRKVASCWFSERRFAGRGIGCSLPGVADCTGYDNTALDCLCEDGQTTFEIPSCDALGGEAALEHYETCGVEVPTLELCERYTAYPGVYCYEDNEGNSECYCADASAEFISDKPCDELTDEEVYAQCVMQPVSVDCTGASGAQSIACAEIGGGSVGCICTDSGAMLELDDTCATLDLEALARSCPTAP